MMISASTKVCVRKKELSELLEAAQEAASALEAVDLDPANAHYIEPGIEASLTKALKPFLGKKGEQHD